MSLDQITSYETIEEVQKKSFVAKKAMAEAIGAKWLSLSSEPSKSTTNSQVIQII
jgi:hypothetical protein